LLVALFESYDDARTWERQMDIEPKVSVHQQEFTYVM